MRRQTFPALKYFYFTSFEYRDSHVQQGLAGCVRRIFMTFEYTDTGRPGRARYDWWENYDFVPNYLEIMSVRIPLRIVSI